MMCESGTNPSSFGHWGNTEERLQELTSRLSAWYLSGDQVPEIFVEAQRKMADAMNQYEDPMDAPKEILFEAFEDTLDHFDNILMTFPQSIEGWCENDE